MTKSALNNLPWFRMYHEFATDPKVQMLSEVDQRRYIMLLCLRCSNGTVTLHESEIVFQLRISEEEWCKTKKTLLDKKLIDKTATPTNWDKRQFVSDSSVARSRRHRNKMQRDRHVACNGDATKSNALDTDTDTDTDSKKNKRKKKSRFVKPTLDELITEFYDRVHDPTHQGNKFFNYYESNGWRVGKNPMKSWRHAVTSWVTRSNENGNSNRPDQPTKLSTVDRAGQEANEYLEDLKRENRNTGCDDHAVETDG